MCMRQVIAVQERACSVYLPYVRGGKTKQNNKINQMGVFDLNVMFGICKKLAFLTK